MVKLLLLVLLILDTPVNFPFFNLNDFKMEITVNKLHDVGHLGEAVQGHPEGYSLAEVSLQVWELHGVQAGVHHHLVQAGQHRVNVGVNVQLPAPLLQRGQARAGGDGA